MERVSDVQFAANMARQGFSVAWVTVHMDEALAVMRELAGAEGVSHVVRASGRERVDFAGGGSVTFASLYSLARLRGCSVRVVIAAPAVLADEWAMMEIRPCVATSVDPEPFYSTFDHVRINR